MKFLVWKGNILHNHQKAIPCTVVSSFVREIIILITQLSFSMPFSIVCCTDTRTVCNKINTVYCYWFLGLFSSQFKQSFTFLVWWELLHAVLTKGCWWWIASLHSARKGQELSGSTLFQGKMCISCQPLQWLYPWHSSMTSPPTPRFQSPPCTVCDQFYFFGCTKGKGKKNQNIATWNQGSKFSALIQTFLLNVSKICPNSEMYLLPNLYWSQSQQGTVHLLY